MTSRLREGVLWAGAVCGLLSLVAAVAVTFFGFSFLIFRSGSMGPEIPTGSLALARTVPAAELRAQDVVSVIAFNGERITHRVVSATQRGDGAALVLQGDANGTPDEEIYLVTEAEREIASVPYVGYAVTVLLTPAGLVAGGCLAVMLVVLGFGGAKPAAPTRGGGSHRADTPGRRKAATALASVSVAAAFVAGAGVTGTSAAFTDQGTARSGDLTARSLPTPVLSCTQGSGASVTISLPTTAYPSSVAYEATLNTGTTLTVGGSGGSRTVAINQNKAPPGGNFLFGGATNYTVTVSVTIGGWSAASTTDIRSTRASLFGGSTDITCP